MNVEVLVIIAALLFGFLFPWERYPKAKLVFIGVAVVAVMVRVAFRT
ncbi:hypothetical protein MCELHM10_01495 [Paracoccaceae bacterium]